MKYPSFVGGSYISQSPIASNERTINFYVETIQSEAGTTKAALYPTPGTTWLAEASILPHGGSRTTVGPGRAHFYQNGREFAVIGSDFVEISEFCADVTTFTPAVQNMMVYGTVAVDANPATICGNGEAGGQIFITSGTNGYIFTLSTNVLTQIAAMDGIATQGEYLGGYFLALNAATATVRISDLLDGTTWDPTQFFTRSASADGWISMKANQYLYLLGTKTGEVWFNSGAFPIPFELHPSGRIQYGTGAAFSAEVVGTSLIWVGATENGHGSVLRTQGFSIEVISDFSTYFAFDNIADISDAIGDSYEEGGHIFYILTFPGANCASWVFDQSMDVWCERSTWNADAFEWQAWRPIFHVFAFGQHRMLDLFDSHVYLLTSTVGYDNGEVIRRLRRPPTLMNENKRVFYGRTELFLEPGLGTVDGQGYDPQVMRRLSNDGGKTWGTEVMRGAGKMGEWDTRVYWTRGGSARKRIEEYTFTDPIPWRVLDSFIEAEAGRY